VQGLVLKKIDSSNVIRNKLTRGRQSPLRTYIELTVGESTFLRFIFYEFITCVFGPMPGGLGFFLRKKFYPRIFKKAGRSLIIGRNVVFRHPDKIELGDNITIDDNCVIDGRGAGDNGVVFEDGVIINRNCMVLAKAGPIHIGNRTSVGSNSVIVSMDKVEIGNAVLTAAGCSISAGSYHFEDPEKPIMDQGLYTKGPIRIGEKSWLGTGVIVLDGVAIGAGAVVGAGALVNKDIPDRTVAIGVPARVHKRI
jgi:acetyltransferase-like isoleucine patch superfamily enzyme